MISVNPSDGKLRIFVVWTLPEVSQDKYSEFAHAYGYCPAISCLILTEVVNVLVRHGEKGKTFILQACIGGRHSSIRIVWACEPKPVFCTIDTRFLFWLLDIVLGLLTPEKTAIFWECHSVVYQNTEYSPPSSPHNKWRPPPAEAVALS